MQTYVHHTLTSTKQTHFATYTFPRGFNLHSHRLLTKNSPTPILCFCKCFAIIKELLKSSFLLWKWQRDTREQEVYTVRQGSEN